ncbi:MAG: hypothetical protein L0332_30380 [Chloroflexi bacterium]|nr:hypothetical protein [Chloroflexota bacterium]
METKPEGVAELLLRRELAHLHTRKGDSGGLLVTVELDGLYATRGIRRLTQADTFVSQTIKHVVTDFMAHISTPAPSDPWWTMCQRPSVWLAQEAARYFRRHDITSDLNGLKPEDAAKLMLSTPVVQIIGPFRGGVYRLVVDGCQVPHIELHRPINAPQGWELVVDDRFAADVSEDEVLRWGYVLANAMAVSAGYTCHGPNSQPYNLFKRQVVMVYEDEADAQQ